MKSKDKQKIDAQLIERLSRYIYNDAIGRASEYEHHKQCLQRIIPEGQPQDLVF